MSYMLDVDEIREDRLLSELIGRYDDQSKGLCDYCHRSPVTKSCKEYERHKCSTDPELAAEKLSMIRQLAAMSKVNT